MKDQHTKIKGYRDLSQEEIDLMNEVKSMSEKVGALCSSLRLSSEELDSRWIAIGETQLQQGFMALTRAIAQPSTF